MEREEIKSKVISLIKERLELNSDTDIKESDGYSDFCADSLDAIEVVMDVEREFHIIIDDTHLFSMVSVKDLIDEVCRLISLAQR